MKPPESTSDTLPHAIPARRWPGYRTVWRWHFYAGLFCIPFVLWLSLTGSIYLFKPQIDAWLDRGYDQLQVSGDARAPKFQVAVAVAAVPGSVFNAYELPATPRSAVRILVGRDTQQLRVYVHPETLKVLGIVDEDQRFTKVISRLHGELMMGGRGSMLVELAASWAIVMLLSGLYLWWPRTSSSAAGILYPRLGRSGRVFWRDMHAVTGVWVSLFALFLLISGLPWAKSWGGMLKDVRQLASPVVVRQDWSTGSDAVLAERRLANAAVTEVADEHAGHHRMAMPAMTTGTTSARSDYRPLDRLVETVRSAGLAAPVLIAPPSGVSDHWSARSATQNRPQQVTLTLDPVSAEVLKREDFAQKSLLDRVIGFGIAAHEGQLFGWINQALGLFTALSLAAVSVSAVVMWWRRRVQGTLGAPPVAAGRGRFAFGFFALVAVLGVLLPLLGATLLGVLLLERLVLRRLPACRSFLGLKAAAG